MKGCLQRFVHLQRGPRFPPAVLLGSAAELGGTEVQTEVWFDTEPSLGN